MSWVQQLLLDLWLQYEVKKDNEMQKVLRCVAVHSQECWRTLALWLVACICILTLLVHVVKPQYVIVCSENFHIPCHRIWMQLWHVEMNLLTISEWYFFYTVTESTFHEVSSSGTLCFTGLQLSRFDELPLSCYFMFREKMRAHLQQVHHKRWLLQLCIPWI